MRECTTTVVCSGGEAYDALEENTREYIKGLEEVEELVEANMLDNDNEDETDRNEGKYDE